MKMLYSHLDIKIHLLYLKHKEIEKGKFMVEIKFNTDNAAFWVENESGEEEFDFSYAATVVHQVAVKIADMCEDGTISDINGNLIGSFKVDID